MAADKRKATFQPYDMDTAAGTNNSGVLMFGYALEDTDTVSSIISGGDDGGKDAPVFNAQDSVLWNNFRDCFRSEITQMYRSLRTSRALDYKDIMQRRHDHQSYWPEAMFNEDQYEKHLVPLINPVTVDDTTGELIRTDRYLTMIQGSKEEQFKWWLYNRFRYMDSKFVTGDAANNIISMRVFNSGTLTLTPAIDLYVGVSFGGGTTVALKRTTANVSKSFVYQAETGVTEMETWIYSGDLIADLGDLSVFYGNEFDLSKATRLRRLKIGDPSASYSNANLVTLDMRNMGLLEYVDLRNCPNLAIPINLEGSPRLEEAYFEGTAITGVDIAEGGSIEKLHLPGTIATLTLINLSKLTDFQCPSLANVSRLMLSNMDQDVIDPIEVLAQIKPNSQVNIQGLYLECENAQEIEGFLNILDTMQGVSRERGANGEWLYHDYDTAQVSGTIHTSSLTGAQIASYNARYPYIKVEADHVTSYLTYASYDGSTTYKTVQCLDGVPQESAPTNPTRESTAQYSYTFVGWSKSMNASTADADAQTAVLADRTIYAAYTATVRTYTVQWKNYDGTTLETDSNVPYGSTPHYDGSTPTYDGQTSTGWTPEPTTVTGDAVYVATYINTYNVYFYNGTTLLQTVEVQEGGSAVYTGETPTSSDASMVFTGWSPSPTNITANLSTYAQFSEPETITDTWSEIFANEANGTYSTKYSIGDTKSIDLGSEGVQLMEIVAFDTDDKADGSGKAKITWISKNQLNTTHVMNASQKTVDGETAYTAGGWEHSDMRDYLKTTIKPLIPQTVRDAIVPVTKIQSTYTGGAKVKDGQTTTDDVWIPSNHEVGFGTDFETTGAVYSNKFTDDASRIKKRNGSAKFWWLRSVNNTNNFRNVYSDGGSRNSSAGSANGVTLGFCT